MTLKITDSPLAGRIWALLATVLLSYAGYDQYEKSQASTETTVNVNLESVPDNVAVHSHGPVLTREQVGAIVASAVAKQHQIDLTIFKQKEDWE